MATEDQLLDSNYDGIKEYDNQLPRWWVQLFWITIILGVIYAVWFHAPSTPTPKEELAAGLAELKALRSSASAHEGAVDLAKLVTMSTVVESGKTIFASRCVACHAAEGQGLVGPNLTDNFWIHGGSPQDIHKVITEGVVAKGMIAWKDLLSADEINALVAFIWSIRGTTPPNPKAPEGAPLGNG